MYQTPFLSFLQAGLYIFQLLDWYIAAFGLPLFGLLECLIFGWIYGKINSLSKLTLVRQALRPLIRTTL